MKQISYIIIFLLIAVLYVSCKKDAAGEEAAPPVTNLPVRYKTKTVQVKLPAGSKLSLSTSTVFSLNVVSGIDGAGNAKAAYNQGLPSIAYVFDKDNNAVMAGFLTDTSSTISIGSTAEVLLYFSMGTGYQPYEVMNKYIAGIAKVQGVPELKAELEKLFIADPQMLQKGLFANILKQKTEAIIKTGQIPGSTRSGGRENILFSTRPADVTVDANDIRSGLQLAEDGFSHFTITNTFRRRAHAYVYKMSYKDLEGKSHTINTKVSGNMTADANLKIGPTGAVRDFKGVLQDWAAGKGTEFAEIKAGPLEVPLGENESEALYKIRVVGPGIKRHMDMTNEETKRLRMINLETAAFDFIIPFMLDVVGHKDVLEKLKMNTVTDIGSGKLQDLLDKTSDIINAIPKANDALESGDYKVVMEEFVLAFINGRMATVSNEWLEFFFDYIEDVYAKHMQNGGKEYFSEYAGEMNKKVTKVLKVMEVMDIGMKIIDYGRLTKHLLQSRTLEDWDLRAKEIEMNLEPRAFVLNPLEQQKLTAHIKTTLGDNDLIEYQWETTGKYGYLWDDRGHKGTAFSSSVKEAYYLCNAMESNLSDGDNIDEIKVTAFLKKGQTLTKVGSASAMVNVKKARKPIKKGASLVVEANMSVGSVQPDGYRAYSFAPYLYASFAPEKDAKHYSVRMYNFSDGRAERTVDFKAEERNTAADGFYKVGIQAGGLTIINSKTPVTLDHPLLAPKIRYLNSITASVEVTVSF